MHFIKVRIEIAISWLIYFFEHEIVKRAFFFCTFFFPNTCYVGERIVIMKKFEFEILTYKVSWIHFGYFYGDVICMCMWINTIASKWCIRPSSNSVRILQVIGRWTLLIFVSVEGIVFLQEYTKEFLYITAHSVKFFKEF